MDDPDADTTLPSCAATGYSPAILGSGRRPFEVELEEPL
jgi:hypothetical protein